MVLKFFGAIDILNALIAVFSSYAPSIAVYFIFALFIKGLIFSILGDVTSWFDMVAALIIFLALKEIIILATILRFIAVLLFAKGIASMF